jgi:hypothetical protein
MANVFSVAAYFDPLDGLGETSRLRGIIGDRLADFTEMVPGSFSGDGVEPAVAEFLRDDEFRTDVSKCRNLIMRKFFILIS